jgi:hypothetical protein
MAVTDVGVAMEKPIVLRMDDVGVEGVEGPRVTRAKARKVLNEARKSYAKIANHFSLNSSRIFYVGRRLPSWMSKAVRKDPRIWVVLEEEVDVKDTGAEAYLRRMQRGRFRIHVPAPGDELAPEDRYLIWREMAIAILCHTTWRACPSWLRTGIAEVMGERGAKDPCLSIEEMKKDLQMATEEPGLQKILGARSEARWGLRQRAVCWALARALEESRREFVPGLLVQIRSLLGDLVHFPKDSAVVTEYTSMVFDDLEGIAGGTAALEEALLASVRAGFPSGSAHRRTDAYKVLKKLKIPRACGVGMAGRFGSRHHVDDGFNMHTYQPFSNGQVTWRLPWESRMEAWVGVRGKPGANYSLRPNKAKEGYYCAYPAWSAGREGKRRLDAIKMDLPRQTTKFGFIWVLVTSPHGLGYVFQKEYRLK